MIKYLLSLLLIFLLSSCYSINTKTEYNRNLTNGYAVSNPIYLSFQDNKKASYYFIIKQDISTDYYNLYVRWESPSNENLFDGIHSSLKFLINNTEIITLNPISSPKIISYNLETKGHEEEAIFKLTSEQLFKLAKSKRVQVALKGKHIIVIGYFNRMHTFPAFKNFLQLK